AAGAGVMFSAASLGGGPAGAKQADAGPGQGVAGEPTADRHGDPLPPGAVARLGTVRFRAGTGAAGVAFSPDGKLLAVGGLDGAVILTDPRPGRQLRRIDTGSRFGSQVAFSPDGKRVTVAPLVRGGPVRQWDVATGREVPGLEGVSGTAVTFSPDGKFLIAVNAPLFYQGGDINWIKREERITLRDAVKGDPLQTLDRHPG